MKLYYAIRPYVETLFLSDLQGAALKREAEHFLAEEARNKKETGMQVSEITKIEEIPKAWDEGCYLWGSEKEISAQDWLGEHGVDAEYKEYMRLKKKFG